MSIRLHIERLVLDGLPVTAADAPRVKAALEAELTRLLAAGGLRADLAAGGAVPSVQAPPISSARGVSSTQLGTRIAQAVHGGIGESR